MPYCQVADDVRLFHLDFGEGPAVVFTHAGQLTHKMWESQLAAVAGRYRAIAYDWRGVGASDKPRGGYTAETVATDLCALVERTGVAPATLVGHGIGSHVTLLAAEMRPDLVKAMVLASAAPWFAGERDGSVGGLSQEFLDFIARANMLKDGRGVPYPQACAELGEHWCFHRPQPAAVQHALLEQGLAWPQYVINAFATSMRAIDHRERLKRIQCPTLVIQGRYDRKQRYEGGVYFARRIAGARLVTLEDSAHMGQIEEINAFNAAVLGFLADVEAMRRAA